jgi:undecaprenyl-diphosphatase
VLHQIITLALVQGLTEFLPVSSSAHLILVPHLAGWPDQGIAFDVAVHVGTLIAVCLYFRKDLLRLTFGLLRSIRGKPSRYYSPLAWQLILATIPIALIGFLAHDFVATTFRSPVIIAVSTIFFGLVLWKADKVAAQNKRFHKLTTKDAMIIGLAQVLALIPGTSRSGITLTAGLGLGYHRNCSAKFSFLLSIPVILLAGGYEGLKILKTPDPIPWMSLSIGVVVSMLSAYVCIHAFLQLLRKIGVLPFVIYRLALGAVLMLVFV